VVGAGTGEVVGPALGVIEGPVLGVVGDILSDTVGDPDGAMEGGRLGDSEGDFVGEQVFRKSEAPTLISSLSKPPPEMSITTMTPVLHERVPAISAVPYHVYTPFAPVNTKLIPPLPVNEQLPGQSDITFMK